MKSTKITVIIQVGECQVSDQGGERWDPDNSIALKRSTKITSSNFDAEHRNEAEHRSHDLVDECLTGLDSAIVALIEGHGDD